MVRRKSTLKPIVHAWHNLIFVRRRCSRVSYMYSFVVFTWVCKALFRPPRIPPWPAGWKRECKGRRVVERPELVDCVFASEKNQNKTTRALSNYFRLARARMQCCLVKRVVMSGVIFRTVSELKREIRPFNKVNLKRVSTHWFHFLSYWFRYYRWNDVNFCVFSKLAIVYTSGS